jgi:hypothetical protein
MRTRLLLIIAVSLVALFGSTTMASAQPGRSPGGSASIQAASCWVNVFAWVSTSPSQQGNLSSIVSCNTTVARITQTMYVHDYYTGAIVATVGPLDQFNTTSQGIAYHWYCSPFSPRTLWGEVRGTVVEYSGAVSNGSWGTQALSC